MHIGANLITIALVIFLMVMLAILILNFHIIKTLRKEKSALSEDQKLLVTLLGEIQGYFSRIDHTIKTASLDERHFQETVNRNQSHETTILEALERNQVLFLERIDHLVALQQKQHVAPSTISPEMVKAAGTFMALQKRDTELIKTKLDTLSTLSSTLKNLEERIGKIEHALGSEFSHITADLKRGVNQNMLEVNETFNALNRSIEEKTHNLHAGIDAMLRTKEQMGSLNTHIDIAKRNMQHLIEQSMDVTPIYKSIHELLNRVSNMFHDYHIAKGEIEAMVHTLQEHEYKDIKALRDDVELFLAEIRLEMHNSVEMLKREYHLGHNQVADSVKKLTNRSMVAQAYEQKEPSAY